MGLRILPRLCGGISGPGLIVPAGSIFPVRVARIFTVVIRVRPVGIGFVGVGIVVAFVAQSTVLFIFGGAGMRIFQGF